jgi:hypothetical protein
MGSSFRNDFMGFDGGRTRVRTLDPLIKRKRVIFGLRQKAFSSVHLDAWVRQNGQKLLGALESE